VAVKAAPTEGKANVACVRALARVLGVARSSVALDPSSRSRRKRVSVEGDPAQITGRLASLAGAPEEIA
jgi:uncharacterized protein YggU (UPF0235/DUF167 family)